MGSERIEEGSRSKKEEVVIKYCLNKMTGKGEKRTGRIICAHPVVNV